MAEEKTGWARRREFTSNAIKVWYGAVRTAHYRRGTFGKRPVVLGRKHFRFRGTVRIGDRFMAEGTMAGVMIKVARGGVLSAGDNLYMNSGCWIEASHEVRIGHHVLMAPNASIVDDAAHDAEPGAARYKGPVIVGNNVWLGPQVAVLPGVTIGDGSVIGANSVVSRDIPPNCFAAGAPARVIRKLEIPDGWDRL